jgi:hypothetical protein
MTQLNLNDARCEALFASGVQRSKRPTAQAAAEAISRAVRQFGIRGCASRMAQEFGEHPQAAAERMRWARLVVAEITARPQPALAPHGQCRTPARTAPSPRRDQPGLAEAQCDDGISRAAAPAAGHTARRPRTRPADRRQR